MVKLASQKRVKSIKNELLIKAREAILSAVQIYNNPQTLFKAESFIALSVIGWTYLLHAYYRSARVDYRYFKIVGRRKRFVKTRGGAFKYWELEKCLDFPECPIDQETKSNLKFLIGIRHEIEHQMTQRIDEYISAKLQACAINFDHYICELFGEKYNLHDKLSLAIQFSPLSPQQGKTLLNNSFITSNVKNFISDFENNITDTTLESSRYSYRVIFTRVNTNRKGQADQVVEFVDADSPYAKGLKKSYAVIKETEKNKYLPSEIVKLMQKKGYKKFSMHKHTCLWQSKDAKNEKNKYGTTVCKKWYWYDNWLEVVEEYCKQHSAELT